MVVKTFFMFDGYVWINFRFNFLPFLRPCPPFREFRWRVGDEVDDLSRANL